MKKKIILAVGSLSAGAAVTFGLLPAEAAEQSIKYASVRW